VPTELVTFDAGQTLVELDLDFLATRLGERGIATTAATLSAATAAAWKRYDALVDAGAPHPWQAFMEALLSGAGVPDVAPLVEWLWREQPTKNLFRKPIADMIALARELAAGGVRVAVLSNSEGRLAELLEEVGVDATRWFLVARSADTAMEFDLDLAAKQSSDNPVYYVQYAHARLARVLAESSADEWRDANVSLLTQPAELALIRRMLQLPEVVELAERNLAPHHVPHYAYELARATTAWYEAGNEDASVRVLVADPALQAARLKLAAAARRVLANSLDLIGVQAPGRPW